MNKTFIKIDKEKLFCAMADAGKGVRDIESISNVTYYKIQDGCAVTVKTLGRLAKELGVKASDIMLSDGIGDFQCTVIWKQCFSLTI